MLSYRMRAQDGILYLRFLYQMDHIGEEDYVPNPVLEKALDTLFLIHADHELNASCTTVLQTGSSLVDPYSAIAYVPSVMFSCLKLTALQCRLCVTLVSMIAVFSLLHAESDNCIAALFTVAQMKLLFGC